MTSNGYWIEHDKDTDTVIVFRSHWASDGELYHVCSVCNKQIVDKSAGHSYHIPTVDGRMEIIIDACCDEHRDILADAFQDDVRRTNACFRMVGEALIALRKGIDRDSI